MSEHRIELLQHGVFASGVIAQPVARRCFMSTHWHTTKATLTASGAINANSGAKTGRSPKDKRIVESAAS